MKMKLASLALVATLFGASSVGAADNLRLNNRLDYASDSLDGPLITGEHMDEGATEGKPNYVIIYGEGCFNSKRQARRTVSLYEKYKDRVHFVVIDLDKKRSVAQQQIVKEYYTGYIPHVVVLDGRGKAAYNSSGEVDEKKISGLLDGLLQTQQN